MNLYWIGTRQYDIINNPLFTGSVTYFGEDSATNHCFFNNVSLNNYNAFVEKSLKEIISEDSEAYFLFANEQNAYKYGKEIFEKSICLNPIHIIDSMNDKVFARNFMSAEIHTPSSIVINAKYCTNYNFISNIFGNKYTGFVLQESTGAGGYNNYYLSSDSIPALPSNLQYLLVTPYLKNTIPVNVHILVDTNTFKILPPSVQIITDMFHYSGSDFIAYYNLPSKIKNIVISCAERIARKVLSIGGRGIFGIDLLITQNDVIFLECNYRYQGSSFLLNKALINMRCPSIFEMRINSFYKNINYIPDDIYNKFVQYSSFRRTIKTQNIKLPTPVEIIAQNNAVKSSKNDYIQYEIFKTSINQSIEKQEVRDPC